MDNHFDHRIPISPIIVGNYQSTTATFGFLVFILLGLVCYLIWSLPFFVGIVLMILSLIGVFPFQAYQQTLGLAGISSSWMTQTWFWAAAALGILTNLILTLELLAGLKFRRFRFSPPTENLALVNCWIIDGNRNSEIIQDGVILVKNKVDNDETRGIITAVGPKIEITIPPDYNQVDLDGRYVLPGLINAHCHMFGDGKPSKLQTLSPDTMEKILGLFQFKFMQRIYFRKMVENMNTALNAGVTTLRTMGDMMFMDMKIRDLVNAGKMIGPRLLCAGKIIAPSGGHGVDG